MYYRIVVLVLGGPLAGVMLDGRVVCLGVGLVLCWWVVRSRRFVPKKMVQILTEMVSNWVLANFAKISDFRFTFEFTNKKI